MAGMVSNDVRILSVRCRTDGGRTSANLNETIENGRGAYYVRVVPLHVKHTILTITVYDYKGTWPTIIIIIV